MKIIPAIDLLNGKCVRLLKGDYSKVSNYNNNPIDQVQEFIKGGFNYIHLILLILAIVLIISRFSLPPDLAAFRSIKWM